MWPTHGPPRDDAHEYVSALVAHRLERERGVLAALDAGLATIREIVALLYADVRQELHKAAGMSVWSHLLKLVAEGQVEVEGSAVRPSRARYRARRLIDRRSPLSGTCGRPLGGLRRGCRDRQ